MIDMARKGPRNHLKRSNIPDKVWIRNKKKYKYIRRQSPGPHSMGVSMSLGVLMRDIMKCVDKLKEAQFVMRRGHVKVDGKARKDSDFPVGLMDVVEIRGTTYRIVMGKAGRYEAKETENKGSKPLKIAKKVSLSQDKFQLTFHDGKTKITADNSLAVNDVVLFDLATKDIKDVAKPKTGSMCVIIEGRHAGNTGTIKKISGTVVKDVTVDVDGKDVITRFNYIFPIKEGWL
jgi:small subunit ribosomal protein S4e